MCDRILRLEAVSYFTRVYIIPHDRYEIFRSICFALVTGVLDPPLSRGIDCLALNMEYTVLSTILVLVYNISD